jgi:putative SOS response-associated peptidase YedK
MCNLYSQTKGQEAIRSLARVMRDATGNLPPMPGIFPDYPAPIVRYAPGGEQRKRSVLSYADWLNGALPTSAGPSPAASPSRLLKKSLAIGIAL